MSSASPYPDRPLLFICSLTVHSSNLGPDIGMARRAAATAMTRHVLAHYLFASGAARDIIPNVPERSSDLGYCMDLDLSMEAQGMSLATELALALPMLVLPVVVPFREELVYALNLNVRNSNSDVIWSTKVSAATAWDAWVYPIYRFRGLGTRASTQLLADLFARATDTLAASRDEVRDLLRRGPPHHRTDLMPRTQSEPGR
jgi:hypothetical protein